MSAPAELGFAHVYQPATPGSTRTLLLLHGTGGDEHDLLPLGRMLDPAAGILSPRGQVLEHGMPRFFRRLAEGVFDVDDVKRRANELADFVGHAAARYGFPASGVVAVGFSNGANVAAAVLLLRPHSFAAAILFRAMVPFTPDPLPALPATPVLISNGRQDSLIPAAESERLAVLLRKAGAEVTLAWQPGGHQLTSGDITQAGTWLAGR